MVTVMARTMSTANHMCIHACVFQRHVRCDGSRSAGAPTTSFGICVCVRALSSVRALERSTRPEDGGARVCVCVWMCMDASMCKWVPCYAWNVHRSRTLCAVLCATPCLVCVRVRCFTKLIALKLNVYVYNFGQILLAHSHSFEQTRRTHWALEHGPIPRLGFTLFSLFCINCVGWSGWCAMKIAMFVVRFGVHSVEICL